MMIGKDAATTAAIFTLSEGMSPVEELPPSILSTELKSCCIMY